MSFQNPFPGAVTVFLEETKTTMNDAAELAQKNAGSGSLVCADYQSAGRGRVPDRKWIGIKGESLLFTVVFRISDIPFELSLFPFFAGYSLSIALEKLYGIKGKIKWPNDIIVSGRKLAGIYCRSDSDCILCGIGVNLIQENFETASAFPPCSVRSVTGKTPCRNTLLESILSAMKESLSDPEWKEKGEKSLFRLGEEVLFAEGEAGSVILSRGRVTGLGEYGELILETDSGEQTHFYSGEIYL